MLLQNEKLYHGVMCGNFPPTHTTHTTDNLLSAYKYIGKLWKDIQQTENSDYQWGRKNAYMDCLCNWKEIDAVLKEEIDKVGVNRGFKKLVKRDKKDRGSNWG